MAVTHNIKDMAIPLKQSIADTYPNLNFNFKSEALIPPKPLIPDLESSPQGLEKKKIYKEIYLKKKKPSYIELASSSHP